MYLKTNNKNEHIYQCGTLIADTYRLSSLSHFACYFTSVLRSTIPEDKENKAIRMSVLIGLFLCMLDFLVKKLNVSSRGIRSTFCLTRDVFDFKAQTFMLSDTSEQLIELHAEIALWVGKMAS